MPFIHKQLAVAIILALGTVGASYAHTRGDMEPDSEWLQPLSGNGAAGHSGLVIAKPRDASFANRATSRNGLNVARMLDSAVSQLLASDQLDYWDKHQLRQYVHYLAGLEPGRVGALLEQLAGSQNANLGTATQASMKQLNASLLAAIRQLDTSEEASRVWVQGVGSGGKLDAQHGSAGLKRRSQGLLLGADWSLANAWRFGVVGGKSDSDLSAKRFKGDLDSWHLGTYAARQDGPFALRLGALYSSHAGQNKRYVDVDFINHRERLTGHYKAQSQNVFAELGYPLVIADLRAEPFAGLGLQRYHRQGFREKGGYSALDVRAQTQQNLNTTFGLRLARDFRLDNQMALKPHLSASWTHLYGNVESRVKQSSAWREPEHVNSEFSISGTSLARDSLAVRTGLDVALSAEHSVGLTYTAERGSHSRNQGLAGQWTMAF